MGVAARTFLNAEKSVDDHVTKSVTSSFFNRITLYQRLVFQPSSLLLATECLPESFRWKLFQTAKMW